MTRFLIGTWTKLPTGVNRNNGSFTLSQNVQNIPQDAVLAVGNLIPYIKVMFT